MKKLVTSPTGQSEPQATDDHGLQVAITYEFGDVEISPKFEIPSHGATALFGKSGAGKSSTLHGIAGTIKPKIGKIVFNGTTWFDSQNKVFVPSEKRNIGMVFQHDYFFPHLSIKSNLLYGAPKGKKHLSNHGNILEKLSIEPLLNKNISKLSGGEKQRIGIARALIRDPVLMLMDEPMSSLDSNGKKNILPFLQESISLLDARPVLYVSHDIEEVCAICSHMIVMENGKVIDAGDVAKMRKSAALNAIVS